jgi:transcriptional regulator with XRE-family HTH domain
MQFIQVIESELKKRELTAKKLLSDLGLAPNSMSHWRKGNVPSIEKIIQIADCFDVTVDYLIGKTTIEKPKDAFSAITNVLATTPQRVASLSNGEEVDEELSVISKYLGCPITFLLGVEREYKPNTGRKISELDTNALIEILDILDRCPASKAFKILQIQISQIVVTWLKKKDIDEETLLSYKLSASKVKFLFRVEGLDKADECGFNFSDLMRIRRESGLSVEFLLTGIEK